MESVEWEGPYMHHPLESHTDERGALTELIRFGAWGIPPGGQVYVFTINPGHTRGNHYHEKKREWFFCLQGEVKAYVDNAFRNAVEITLDSAKPSVLYCAPPFSHALSNKTEEMALVMSYASTQHDPDNPDTWFRKVSR